jgi:[ribosomal protein S5]-alanine N-acetyltransferase
MSAVLDILSGHQVTLRPFRATDITPAYLGWLRDPEVVRFSNQRFRTHTEENCAAYLASFHGTANLFLSVVRHADERPVGTMTAYVSAQHGTADLGILIGDRTCWGRGFGLDAWQTLMDHLFQHAGLRKITAGTLRPNVGMVRIMERAGMHLEGVRERQEIIEGVPVDALLYASFRSD